MKEVCNRKINIFGWNRRIVNLYTNKLKNFEEFEKVWLSYCPNSFLFCFKKIFIFMILEKIKGNFLSKWETLGAYIWYPFINNQEEVFLFILFYRVFFMHSNLASSYLWHGFGNFLVHICKSISYWYSAFLTHKQKP